MEFAGKYAVFGKTEALIKVAERALLRNIVGLTGMPAAQWRMD